MLLSALVSAFVWNSLHSYVHYLEVGSYCSTGISLDKIGTNNAYIQWALNNHRAHHYFKGAEKGNFNVVYPGADYFFGTYNVIPPK